MIFGSLFARPRSSSNDITTKSTSPSQGHGSVDVYTVDSSYTVARCSLNSTTPSRGDTTSTTGAIRRCNRSHFKLELFGKAPMCYKGKVTSIGFLRAAVFLEIVAFIVCNIFVAIQAFLGHPAGACFMGLLAVSILLASLPLYLGTLSSNAPSLSYFYDWIQRTGKLASFVISSDDAYFDSASVCSLKSYPYEGQEKRAPGGAERCKTELRIPLANSENPAKDLQNKLIPSEILPFERAPSPDSVYCDKSFVESATPQSVYCITGLTKCSNDPHAYFDTGIPYSVGIHKVDIVPHRKMVYFASLQPNGALGDIIASDSWNPIPATVHQTTPELSHKLTAKELVAQMPKSKI
ncbi:hypothetical protein Tcan_06512 [Toxocara canis]|uniref:Uncharacterized protein n=1 Tax=Toxocara canis TaxID=6265 RepID=A0A0B2VA57_TOXCA|nr:hypothetical protein Tcan_06512 [Toxocara canis]